MCGLNQCQNCERQQKRQNQSCLQKLLAVITIKQTPDWSEDEQHIMKVKDAREDEDQSQNNLDRQAVAPDLAGERHGGCLY